jgi:hypothetical protein
MVMSYLVTSNADYTRRVDEIEQKIDILLDKMKLLEYNISVLSDALNKELDFLSDKLRAIN